jgi:hypothetical protein
LNKVAKIITAEWFAAIKMSYAFQRVDALFLKIEKYFVCRLEQWLK